MRTISFSFPLSILASQWAAAAPMATYVPPPDLTPQEMIMVDDECTGKDPDKEKVLKLVKKIEKGEKKIKSVDEFLKALPEKMRQDFVMMTESRSFQQSSAKDPRVLLKSPNAEMIVSFNSNPAQRGYQNVEIMFWNEKNQSFQFIDLQFPKDQAHVPGETGAALPTKVQVTRNPDSCLKCHGNPPRPNWDPYNFWSGQTPFNRDTLSAGSPENKIYADILRRIKKGESRFRHLKPTNSVNKTLKSIADNETLQLRTSDSEDGPGVRMFDQLTPLNHCRIAHELRKYTPQLKDFSAAVRYSVQFCGNIDNALPQWVKDQARDYFEGRNIKDPSTGEFSYAALTEDTKKRQDSVFNDKLARQRLFFEKEFGSAELAEKAMTARETENRETSLESLTKMRYFLEPLGVPVNSWSMSLDPETYTFADLFNEFRALNNVGVEDPSKTYSCDQLKQMSLETLANANPVKHLAAEAENCVRKVAEEKAVGIIASTGKDLIQKNMMDLLEKYKCAACHVDDEYFMGAPALPFRDAEKLEKMMKTNRGGDLANWSSIFWSRITRGESAPGRMPAVGPPIYDTNDLAAIKAYLDTVKPAAQP